MSHDAIIALDAADAVWSLSNPQPAQSVLISIYNDGADKQAYLANNTDIVDWPSSAYVVGSWDLDQESEDGYLQTGQTFGVGGVVNGTPTYPLQPDYTAYIRPLGNDDGEATGLLDSIRWAGHPEAKWLEDDNR